MIELLKNRRSVRKFLDKPIEKDVIDKLIYAALLGPSSKDSRPWEFVVVQDENVIHKLSECKPVGSSFLKHTPLAIIVTVDPAKSNAYIEDATIASTYMQLTAEKLDLGSCWVQVRGRQFSNAISSGKYIQGELNIPDHLEVMCILAFGYKETQRSPHHEGHLKFDQVHYEKFGGEM